VTLSDWYLKQGDNRIRWIGFKLLTRIPGDRADDLISGEVTDPHGDYRMVEAAVNEATKRSVSISRNLLLTYAFSDRFSLARAVHALNDSLGYAPLAPFDSTQTIKSPGMAKLMSRIDSLAVDDIPATAPYVRLQYTDVWPHLATKQDQVSGWMLEESERSYSLYNPSGYLIDGDWSDSTRDVLGGLLYTQSVKELPISYDEEAQRIQQEGFWHPPFASKEFGTPQLYEINLARWLYHDGPTGSAAKIVFPMIERYPNDEALLETAREKYGNLVGYRMLQAFVGDRDYDEAMRLATIILAKYPNTLLAKDAAGLLDQLPKRMNDFKELSLPTPAEWAELQRQLSREQQIGYMLERLRLINVDCSLTDQYREPRGLSQNATYFLRPGSTRVVSPLDVLWRGSQSEMELNLEVRDLLQIIPYLSEDWYILEVQFPSDWGPSVSEVGLARCSYYLGFIINNAAGEDIFSHNEFWKLEGEEKAAYIDGLMAWTRQNMSKTPDELLCERIAKADVRDNLHVRLMQLTCGGSVAGILDIVDPDTLSADDILRVLGYTSELLAAARGWPTAVPAEYLAPFAGEVLDRPERNIRLETGRVLLEAGDPRGAEVLRQAINESELTPQTMKYLGYLLREGDSQAKAIADHLLPGAKKALARNLSSVMQLIYFDRPEGYRWILEALADTSATGVHRSHPSGSVPVRFNLEAANYLLKYDALPDSLKPVSDVSDLSYESQAQVLEKLAAWARERLEEASR